MADVDFNCNAHLVVKASQEALLKAGEQIGGLLEGKAKMLAPVDTGLLRNSIAYAVEQEDGTTTVILGTNVEYAPYQELGTSKMQAQPFLRPAMEGSASEIEHIVKQYAKG